jgi:small-conductance mechanosensitive channel
MHCFRASPLPLPAALLLLAASTARGVLTQPHLSSVYIADRYVMLPAALMCSRPAGEKSRPAAASVAPPVLRCAPLLLVVVAVVVVGGSAANCRHWLVIAYCLTVQAYRVYNSISSQTIGYQPHCGAAQPHSSRRLVVRLYQDL